MQTRATLSRSGLGLIEAYRQSDIEEGSNLLLLVDQFEEIFRFQFRPDASLLLRPLLRHPGHVSGRTVADRHIPSVAPVDSDIPRPGRFCRHCSRRGPLRTPVSNFPSHRNRPRSRNAGLIPLVLEIRRKKLLRRLRLNIPSFPRRGHACPPLPWRNRGVSFPLVGRKGVLLSLKFAGQSSSYA